MTASRLVGVLAIAAGLLQTALAPAAQGQTGTTPAVEADDSRLEQDSFRRGETAFVRVDGAEFVDSNHTLIAKLAKGTAFDVASTAVAWVGGYVEIDGRRRSGWIHAKHLAATPPGSGSAPSPR